MQLPHLSGRYLGTKGAVALRCLYLQKDGKCSGRYKGFACIGDRCKADKEACPHYDRGFYCTKFGRFGCVGMSRCGETVDEYLRVFHRPKAKA